MGAPFHGKNGLIYISGTEIAGAHAWSMTIDTDSVETPQFGDSWKKHVTGMQGWSGSVTAWEQGDAKVLSNAATAGTTVALLIYPNKNDVANYYNGNAIFGFGTSGDTGSAVANTADFTGDDTLTIAGFS